MRDSRRATRPLPRGASVAVAIFYCLLFAALVWPIYPRFATIEPRVLAMPHGLAYVVGGLLLSFAVLAGLFALEGRGDTPTIGGEPVCGAEPRHGDEPIPDGEDGPAVAGR